MNTMNVKSGVVNAKDSKCHGRAGDRVCNRWSTEDSPKYKLTEKEVTCKQCLRIMAGKFHFDVHRWATVCLGMHHICVHMKPDETEEELVARVEDSLWGPPAEVKGVYPTPWNK